MMLALAILLAGGAPATSRTGQADQSRVEQAARAADANDCATAQRLVAPLLPPESAPPTSLGASALAIAAVCEARTGHGDLAYPHLLRATATGDPPAFVWRLRLALELEAHRTEAAVVTLEKLVEGRGAILNSVPGRWLYALFSAAKSENQPALRERLLRIAALSYSPDPIDGSSDGFRLLYARQLLGEGKRQEAIDALQGVTAPMVIHDVMLDPELRTMLPQGTDLRALTERSLAANLALVDAHPDRLSPVLEAADDLMRLGRPREALALIEGVRGKVEGSGYTDIDDRRPWWWDGLYRAHYRLGEREAAIAALRAGMAVSEGGGRNVSQVINLMFVLNALGQPRAALDAEAQAGGLGVVSPFGEMQLRDARGCAHAQLGHVAQAQMERAYMEAHRRDAPAALGELQLCMGDLDAAAADVIARLGSVEDRQEALAEFSIYATPPVPLPETLVERNRKKIASRPDVKAALARVGGPVTFTIQRPAT